MCRVEFDPPESNPNGRWHTARITFDQKPKVLRWVGNERIKYTEFYPSNEELERGWVEKRLFIDSFPELEIVREWIVPRG